MEFSKDNISRVKRLLGYILATDKSIVISGWKHGTTELNHIFRQELLQKGIKLRYDDVYGNNNLNFINRGLLNGLDKINNFPLFKDYIKKYYDELYYHEYFDPTLEIFKTILNDNNNKPIFVFIRDPKKTFISCFHQDLNRIVSQNRDKLSSLLPQLGKFNTPNTSGRSVLKNFLLNSSDIEIEKFFHLALTFFDKDVIRRSHVNTFHLTEVLQFLNLTEKIIPDLSRKLFIVDLDKYSNSLRDTLVEFKAMRHSEEVPLDHSGKFHYSKSNKHIYSKYEFLLESDYFNLPLGNVRLPVESMSYLHINKLYKKYFLSKDRLPL